MYIPQQAKSKLTLEELYYAINTQLNVLPEGVVILAGDFIHVDLETILPQCYKNVHFSTREDTIVDQVYTHFSCAY